MRPVLEKKKDNILNVSESGIPIPIKDNIVLSKFNQYQFWRGVAYNELDV